MIKKRNMKGFTLIELLTSLVIISLIMGVTIFYILPKLEDAKKKTYQTTKINIENSAKLFLNENIYNLFYISDINDSNKEYQCISIRELIDVGILKKDVVGKEIDRDKTVQLDDYIYIEKSKELMTILKSEYVNSNNTNCKVARNSLGDINIEILPTSYSDYVDITITYNARNYININDFDFLYTYSNNNYSVISDNGNVKKIKVTDNGTINAKIVKKNNLSVGENELIKELSKNINNIDKEPPFIELNSDLIKEYGVNFDLYEGVKITDNVELSNMKIYLENNEINSYSDLSLGENSLKYVAIDKFGNRSEKERKVTLIVSEQNFEYNEQDQIYNVLLDGSYIISAYGGQGGNNGGNGGYLQAEITLKKGEQLIINTGGKNGYNGGGKSSGYISGGGATTVRYNGQYVVIAGGGGAKGNSGTPGVGGAGNGDGGTDVGSGPGFSGTNGGGGSNSLNYDYKCNCQSCETCNSYSYYDCNCTTSSYQCNCSTTYFDCNCYKDICHSGGAWNKFCTFCSTCSSLTCSTCSSTSCSTCSKCESYSYYECNCQTCTSEGLSGQGGASVAQNGATLISQIDGNNSGDGHLSIKYKIN